MRDWRAWFMWACLAAPWAIGAYVWGGPQFDVSYRPLLARAFSYYGIAAAALLAVHAVFPDEPNRSPSGKATLLLLNLIAIALAFAMAYSAEDCRLGPFWGCASSRG